MGGSRFRRDAVAHLRLIGNVGQRNSLLAVDAADLGAFKDDSFLFAVQHFSCNSTNPLLELSACLHDRLTGDVGSGGRVGTGVIRGNIGVCTEDSNIIHRAVHQFCHHLCQDGIAACAHVSSADNQVIGAVFTEFYCG